MIICNVFSLFFSEYLYTVILFFGLMPHTTKWKCKKNTTNNTPKTSDQRDQSLGYPPPERTWDQWLEVLWGGDGVPPVWTDKQTKTITFRHPSDTGGKNNWLHSLHHVWIIVTKFNQIQPQQIPGTFTGRLVRCACTNPRKCVKSSNFISFS